MRTSFARTSTSPVGSDQVHRVGRPALDLAEHRDDELGAQPLDALEQRLVAFDDHLRQAVAIADVEEQQRPEVADAMHPPEQHGILADIGRTKRATGMRASEGT